MTDGTGGQTGKGHQGSTRTRAAWPATTRPSRKG